MQRGLFKAQVQPCTLQNREDYDLQLSYKLYPCHAYFVRTTTKWDVCMGVCADGCVRGVEMCVIQVRNRANFADEVAPRPSLKANEMIVSILTLAHLLYLKRWFLQASFTPPFWFDPNSRGLRVCCENLHGVSFPELWMHVSDAHHITIAL